MSEHGEFSEPNPQQNEEADVDYGDISDVVDTQGLENLDLDTPLEQPEKDTLKEVLIGRTNELLQHHPDATPIREEDTDEVIGHNLSINKQAHPELFDRFHLEPYDHVIIDTRTNSNVPQIVLEAVEPNGDVHSMGIGDTNELEVAITSTTTGETISRSPVVADAFFMHDILGLTEETLPHRPSQEVVSQ